MHDNVDLVGFKEIENIVSIPDIEVVMLEIFCRRKQAIAMACRIALRSEKYGPHVVVCSDHLVPLRIEKRDRLRPDQPARTW